MNSEDAESVKAIKTNVAKSDFKAARRAAEQLEARHTTDNCNMDITDVIDALANQDADGVKKALQQLSKWWNLDVKNI